MSFISGTVGAIMGANSQDKANETNAKNIAATNAQNYKMFAESRGSTGSAVLPLYLRTKSGNLFESQLGQDLVDSYDATRQDPATAMANTKARWPASTQPTRAPSKLPTASSMAATWLSNWPTSSRSSRPRLPSSASRRSMRMHKTLGEISAAQATQGFAGDSMGNRMLAFQANRGAADAVSSGEPGEPR